MAGKKKLRSYALYYNLGLAIIWDVIGLFFFVLSLIGVGIPFSFVLDFVAIGTALLFRYLHKLYFLKQSRAIKSEFRALEKVVKKSKKKALAQQYAKARGQLDAWMAKGRSYIAREILRILMTFLLELIPFLGDFSPTWTIKAHFELVKFGQQKKKYQLILYQIQALKALIALEKKVAPGYAAYKRGRESINKIGRGDFSEVKEKIPGRRQYQNVKQGVQKGLAAAQAFDDQAQKVANQAVNTATNVQSRLASTRENNPSYQQRLQRERMIEQQRVRYNETRSSGRAYYNSPSSQGSSLNQNVGQNIRDNTYPSGEFTTNRINQLDDNNSIQPISRKSNDSNESKQTQKELQNA